MATLTLTELAIQKLKSDDQALYWDTVLPNFGVRVGKRTKSFVIIYGDEKNRKVKTIGRFPQMGLKEARIAAMGLLSEFMTQDTSLAQTPYSEAIEGFIQDSQKRLNSESSKQYARYLRKMDFDKNLGDITKGDINEVLREYEGKPWAENYAYASLRVFLNWCLDNEYLTTHPLIRGKPPNKVRSRSRVLTDREMGRIWRATEDDTYGRMVRIIILTGQRRSEVRNLREEDIADGLITFHTKGGNQNILPITPLVEENLVLPFTFNNWSSSLRKLTEKARVDDATHHDLRRTLATKMAQLRVNDIVIERVLGHTVENVKHTYNRYTYLEEVKEALLLYEDHIRKIITA